MRVPDPKPDDIPRLMAKVIETAGPACKGWAIELAAALNRTDKCPRCKGYGWSPKHRNCSHPPSIVYERQCDEPVTCRKCGGSGRLPKPLPAAPAVQGDGR